MENKPVLIFDFFGVICNEVFNVWLQRHELSKYYDAAMEVTRAADIGEINFYEECELLGKFSGQSGEEIYDEWQEIIKINQVLVDFIKNSRGKYRFALLSNSGAEFVRPIIEENELEELFEKIFISSEIKKIKPDIELFLFAMKELGVEPKRCTMIDDKPKNIEGAKAAGMNGVVYKMPA